MGSQMRRSKLEQHLGFHEIRRMRARSRCAGRPEPGAAIEPQSRLVANCEPYPEASRATHSRPIDDLLDQRGCNALLTHRAVDKDADHHRIWQAFHLWREAGRHAEQMIAMLGDDRHDFVSSRAIDGSVMPESVRVG